MLQRRDQAQGVVGWLVVAAGRSRGPALALAAVVTALLLAAGGCQSESAGSASDFYHWTDEGVKDHKGNIIGADGKPLAMPASFQIPPTPPRDTTFAEFDEVDIGREPPPRLGAPMRGPNMFEGVQPLEVRINNDLALGGRPFGAAGLSPADLLPIEQLIHGGPYGEADDPGRYRFLVGDKLRVTVPGHEEFNGVVAVEQDGTAHVPGTQAYVRVEQQTPALVAESIRKVIKPFVREAWPVVRVAVAYGQGGYYYVLGGVRNQGRFPLGPRSIRLSEAVFRANSELPPNQTPEDREAWLKAQMESGARVGYRPEWRSLLDRVVVVTPHRSKPFKRIYNVNEALVGGKQAHDPILKPGQIVVVPTGADRKVFDYLQRALANVVTVKPTVE